MKYLLAGILLLNLSVCAQNSWDCHIIDNAGSGADGIKMTDINNDGLPDITTGWEESGITKLYLHPGVSAVKQKWPMLSVGKTPNVEDAVFADITNNGNSDIVSCTENNSQKIFIHLNRGKEILKHKNWQQVLLPSSENKMSWMYAEPMQIDGINGIDLIAAGKGKNAAIGWFEAPINPYNWDNWEWHKIDEVGWIMSILKTDMDNDKDLDLLITDRRGELQGCRWLENPGESDLQKEEWKNHFIGAQNHEVMFMCIHDLQGNGTQDVIVSERTNQTIKIYSRENNGAKWLEHSIPLPSKMGAAKSVEAGDINNDGVIDLVVSTNTLKQKKHGIMWLDGSKRMTASANDWQSISGILMAKYDKVVLSDLDQDGDLDLVICEENNGSESKGLGVVWYENPFSK